MRFFILLLLFSGFCVAAFAQGRVRGKVLEVKHKVAKVAIDSLGFLLVADIDRSKLVSADAKS